MKKTPSLYKRDYEGTRQALNEVVPGSEWVLEGEGTATLKIDGTSCRVRDGVLYKRYDRKVTKKVAKRRKKDPNSPLTIEDFKSAPEGFEPCEPAPDFVTGHWPGWVPVDPGNPADKYHCEAFQKMQAVNAEENGTYELVGPAIQANPYKLESHELWRHGEAKLPGAPRNFEGLRAYFEEQGIEGIVWHHPDGRLVKIKRRDFGFPWP